MSTEAMRKAFDEAVKRAPEFAPEFAEHRAWAEQFAWGIVFDVCKALAAPEPDGWQGGEEWEPLAWALCAEENGEDACSELIWEGGPVKEPWGDRWMKYEPEAKRMIALVRKHVALAAPEPKAEAMVRFCPGCGSVGPVPETYRDCCPDGKKARMIPASLAAHCHDLFQLALEAAPAAQPQPQPERAARAASFWSTVGTPGG